ncbi:MAG: 23S rRNA (uracil(1939)-C(5))-methyltransferase RlmD, partial [Clostridia bacterium]
LPHAQELIAMLRAALSSFSGLVISCNRQRTNVIFGDACKLLWGSDTLEETLCGLRFSVSARAFFQVNPVQTERLYAAVLAYAALTPTDVAVDAYCGAGTITLLLARQCRQAIGVEIVPEAVENARENARSNGVENVAFHAGEAEKWLPQMLEAGMHPDVVVVDPPRKGCEETVLLAVAKAQPRRVVYVSCNPATLARDAQVLEAQGYPLREVQPVDMFCWSAGVECVALFERGRNG